MVQRLPLVVSGQRVSQLKGGDTLALAQSLTQYVIPTTSVGQTVYTVPGGYLGPNSIMVWMNGSALAYGTDYNAVDMSTVVLSVGAVSTTDQVVVAVFGAVQVALAIPITCSRADLANLPPAQYIYQTRMVINANGSGAGAAEECYSNGVNWVRKSDLTIAG